MTVFYETGIATSPLDLLEKLMIFAEAHGWVADLLGGSMSWGLSSGEPTGQAVAAGIQATTTEWRTRGCEQVNPGAIYTAQIGSAHVTHICNLGAGPFVAYHFYVGDEDGSEYVHVSVEVSAGLYRHWALGQLVPFGAITGGVYCDSSYLETSAFQVNSPESTLHRHLCDANASDQLAHVLLDYDGKVGGQWQSVTAATTLTTTFHTGINRSNGLIYPLMEVGYQRWNLRTPPWPMMYFANRDSSLRSPIGRMPNIRAVNVRNFFPGEIITIGADEWQVFPVFQKQLAAVAAGVPSSGLYGYAHLRP